MEDFEKRPESFIIDEKDFYFHLANLPELLNEFEHEMDVAMHDNIDNDNLEEYHILYNEILMNSPLKNICKYHKKKKAFIISNSFEARELFINNLANGIKEHFWLMGKSNLTF